MSDIDPAIQILIVVVLAAIVVGVAITIIYVVKQKSDKEDDLPVEAPSPSRTRVAAAPPPGRATRPPAPTPAPTPHVETPTVAPEAESEFTSEDFSGYEAEPLSAADELQDDDEGWGADLDIAPAAAAVETPYEPTLPSPQHGGTIEFEDDDYEEEDSGGEGEDELDAFVTKELKDISRETQQSFTQAIIDRDFSISKMKEADEISQRCVASYLDENEVPKGHSMRERLFAIHPKIQVSDLPQFVESYLDDGSEDNQDYFADLEEMCDQHEESVLDLFMQFNSTLPERLKCSLVGETKRPSNAVIFMAPEWDDSDFAKPDFGDDEEDVDDEDDFYEDYYEDLEELEDNDDEDELK